jgi:hypothetical protein
MTAWRVRRELRVLRIALSDWRTCLWSKLALLLGASYLFVPIDIIPDRIPVVGHLDELSFLVLGFVGSRHFVPDALIEQFDIEYAATLRVSRTPDKWQHMFFAVRVLRADLANFFLWQFRSVDGFLITGKNSGTHWLKFMLSQAIAEQFGVPPPSASSGNASDEIIGHPSAPRRYPNMPRIGSSHTIPSIAFAWGWVNRLLPHPPVIVLVREIVPAMRSNFAKWQDRYEVSSAEYVRGDPLGRQFVADVWWYIHFFNRWGDVARAQPDNILVIRYEELRVSPETCLRRIAAHYGIRLSEAAIAAALRYRDREAIRVLLDPKETEIVVPPDEPGPAVFTISDEAFIRATAERFLHCDFGYGYIARSSHRLLEHPGVAKQTNRTAGV